MATITLTSEEQTINLVTEGSVSLSASNGKSAYQSYLSTTTDDPVLTEAQWVASLDGPAGDPGSPGPAGDPGDPGEKGDKGDPGDTGPMPYTYRGAWDGFTNYTLHDAVTYQGSLYWLPATGGWTVGGAPPAYNWELLVSKGDTGDAGDQGDTGKSAYQSYLDTTTDDPVLTEEEWSAGGGGGGGGDYLPLAGGIMDNGAEIAFDNASKIRQTSGSNGIDQVCSIDYVHRWKEGSLYILDQSNGIRSVQHGLSFTPGATFDVTDGYLVGSRFTKDDGTTFQCTNNAEGAAVWVDITTLPIPTPGIAHVNSGGNDTTGAIGDPSRPYLTAQAAWDDGARNLALGSGSYTVTHVSSPSDSMDVFVSGAGKEHTTLDFTFTGVAGVAGVDQLDFGQNGGNGTAGGNAGAFTLSSDRSLAINLVCSGGVGGKGGKGGPGSSDPEIVGGNGGTGGDTGSGPTFEVYNCVLASQSNIAPAGQGGDPGDDGGFGAGTAGTPGAGGNLGSGNYYWSDVAPTQFTIDEDRLHACLHNDLLIARVPSRQVTYGASSVQNALDNLFDGRVEIYRIDNNNFATSSSTVSNVPNLSCAIAAGEQVTIEIFGFHTSGTGGMKICFSGPASPIFVRYNFSHFTSATSVRTSTAGAATDFNVDVTEGAGTAIVTPFSVLLTVKNGTNSGSIQFKAASVTNGQTLTLLRETVMRVTR
jgi:hypothetical protein